MKKVLMIDGDRELCGQLQCFFQESEMELEAVHDATQGLQKALQPGWDMVLMDLVLPEVNGLDLLRQLRNASPVPVVILSARNDEIDRVLGLETGADDYLAKPFSFRELMARIRAILRRVNHGGGDEALPEQIVVGDLAMFPASRSARIGQRNLPLTNMEYQVLEYLVRHAGKQVSREELVTRVLHRNYSPFDRSVDMHISSLRQKLGPYGDGVDRIRTLRGAGYLYAKPLA